VASKKRVWEGIDAEKENIQTKLAQFPSHIWDEHIVEK
jgi:hypothetical protein